MRSGFSHSQPLGTLKFGTTKNFLSSPLASTLLPVSHLNPYNPDSSSYKDLKNSHEAGIVTVLRPSEIGSGSRIRLSQLLGSLLQKSSPKTWAESKLTWRSSVSSKLLVVSCEGTKLLRTVAPSNASVKPLFRHVLGSSATALLSMVTTFTSVSTSSSVTRALTTDDSLLHWSRSSSNVVFRSSVNQMDSRGKLPRPELASADSTFTHRAMNWLSMLAAICIDPSFPGTFTGLNRNVRYTLMRSVPSTDSRSSRNDVRSTDTDARSSDSVAL
mmetsp:Transcript_11728/g.48755  ORF Transcript_11728/g.48755 Transcript_11728/m.48755 type:complete len:272 (+) Transcript_11728:399-1214(+)